MRKPDRKHVMTRASRAETTELMARLQAALDNPVLAEVSWPAEEQDDSTYLGYLVSADGAEGVLIAAGKDHKEALTRTRTRIGADLGAMEREGIAVVHRPDIPAAKRDEIDAAVKGAFSHTGQTIV